jgi:hypothetical protein
MSAYEDEETRSTIWWLVLALVVAVIWAFFTVVGSMRQIAPAIMAGDYASAAGTMCGHALFITLIVWGALYFLIVRSRAPLRGFVYLAILFAAVLATEGGFVALGKWASDRDRAQSRIAAAEVNRAFADAMNPASGSIDMRIKSQGDAGEMERVSKQAAARTLAANRKYRDTLAALGYPAFVSLASMTADPRLESTRAKLRKARAAVQTLRLETEANASRTRVEAQQSRMSDSVKTRFIAGLDKSTAQSTATGEKTLDCEDAILAEYEAVAALLARPKGRWTVSGKVTRFTDDRDLQSYRAHVAKIQQIAGQERALVADAKNQMTDTQESLAHAD